MGEFQGLGVSIREFADGTVVVHSGPMLMSIFASSGGVPCAELARQGAKKALNILEILAEFRYLITRNILEITNNDTFPLVIKKMISACRKFEDAEVTPLIAVAGASADEVAEFLCSSNEVDKVIVNNGGDIAIRIMHQEEVKIGIRTDLSRKAISHVISLGSKANIGGVATSGFGGRSFTKGVANAAVAVASDAITADVAATLIGNATCVESPRVKKDLGRRLYHATDIPNLQVTASIDPLTRPEIDEALDRGMRKVAIFENMGLIAGAIVSVQDHIRISESVFPLIEQVPGTIL